MSENAQVPLRRFDAALPLDESVRMARASWTVHSTRLTPDRFQRLSHLGISPHSLTHMDLPTTFFRASSTNASGPERGSFRPDTSDQNARDFRRPFSVDCVILNLMERLWWMERILHEAMPTAGLEGRLPNRPVALWESKQYKDIIARLAVDVDEIEQVLSRCGEITLKDTCVMLYTGWRNFTPLYKDCGTPHWWAWHPFLLHPYLTREAAGWLRDREVCGLATDAVSVDTPLRNWLWLRREKKQAPWGPVREAVDAIMGAADEAEGPALGTPAHHAFLGSGGFLLESLALTSEVFFLESEMMVPPFGEDGVELPNVQHVRLTVLPFGSDPESEGLLTCILILPCPRLKS